MKKVRSYFMVITVFCLFASLYLPGVPTAKASVLNTSDVDLVWSVHYTGRPVLLTSGNYQYVAYYDKDKYLSVSQRVLGTNTWTKYQTNVQTDWNTASHHAIALGVDGNGYIHLSGAMHNNALRYWRSSAPNDVTSMQRITSMVGSDESSITYPEFFKDKNNKLIYTYRTGSSGNGNQIFNKWNETTQTWSRITNTPVIDGSSTNKSAYLIGPQLSPDGNYHIVFMWRDTSAAETAHDLSYIQSPDLINWYTIKGTPLNLPVTPSTAGVIVDPVPTNSGLTNMSFALGFDSLNRPVISYHKYAPDGSSQIYSARHENNNWNIVQVSNWYYRWNFSGSGSLQSEIAPGGVFFEESDGNFAMKYKQSYHGSGMWKLDEATLQPIGQYSEAPILWPASIYQPESTFTTRPMSVQMRPDLGQSPNAGTKYVLRWETGPNNGDQSVPQPWPAPTTLRVYEIDFNLVNSPSIISPVVWPVKLNLAFQSTVTASSSYENSGWGKAKAVDGGTTSVAGAVGWSSNNSKTVNHTEWIQLDLGASKSLNKLKLYPATTGLSWPVNYNVQLSLNGTNWVTVANVTGDPVQTSVRQHLFSTTNARYIKITGTSLRPNPADSNQYRMQFAEIEAYGN